MVARTTDEGDIDSVVHHSILALSGLLFGGFPRDLYFPHHLPLFAHLDRAHVFTLSVIHLQLLDLLLKIKPLPELLYNPLTALHFVPRTFLPLHLQLPLGLLVHVLLQS